MGDIPPLKETLVEGGVWLDQKINYLIQRYIDSHEHIMHIDWTITGPEVIHTDRYIEGGPGTDTSAIHDDETGEILAIAEKVSPVGADVLIIESIADGNAKRRVTITNLPGGADVDAIHDNVASEISAITVKGTPVGADFLLIEDSAAGNIKKHVLISTMPAGSEANDLETDGTAGIATGELPIGTGAGAVTYQKISTITEEATPATGDWLLGEEAGGLVRRFDIGNLPGGSEVNDLVNDGVAGIAADEVPLGTGAGTVTYVGTSGTGSVLRGISPTLASPNIANFAFANHDHKSAAEGGTVLPLITTVPVIEHTGGLAQNITFDLSAISAFSGKTWTAPDANIDLAVDGTGSYATEAEGNLAATAVQDGGDLSAGSVAHAAIADFVPESILLRESGTGVPADSIFTDIATVSPAGSDFLLGWTAAGLIRKYTVTSLPAGGENNDLEGDGTFGIATGELPIGTGSGAVTYQKISDLAEETTPNAGDFLLGEESGGLVRKFDVGDLPSGTPAADSITNIELANMVEDAIKGRANGGGAGDPQDLTPAQVRTIINVESGATADQTNTEIRDAVEAATNSNTFNDADHTKLGTIADNADVTDEASVTAALPVIDSTVLVKGSVTAGKLMRIEVDGFSGAVTRVLTMADQNIDLTPGTGSFATEAEGGLAASAVQDGGDLSAASVAISALENFKGNSVLINDGTGSAAPQVADELDIATNGSPVGGDFVWGWTAAGLLRKWTIASMPAGSEANDLATDGIAGIANNQLAVGTASGAAEYQTLLIAGEALSFDGTTFSQAAIADLSDVSGTTGTGSTAVMDTSPTIVTPVIAAAGWATANHTHAGGTTGGTIAIADTTGTLAIARGGTGQTTAPEPSKSFTLPEPVIGDIFGMWITNKAITITEIQAICHNGTSVIVNVRNHTSIAAAGGTLIDQITPTTAITSETTISSASVVADRCIFFELGTVTGSVDSVMVTVNYTVD